ncbi:hypothetical protein HPP92_007278 [Vanilla planifolia]|uniref:Uncharacterized protein n=1 Tax=Vanilla planifolia TaxID=51239 RepID=A0A835RDS4_VANPL|nr:hypothetical protein HPP92_007278 [Vanilla planifolia]
MDVQIQRSTVIAASEPTSKPLELPLTVFDRYASDLHIAVLFAFSPPIPMNSDIIDALTKTLLLHFPTLAARLDGLRHRPCLILGGGGDGALVVEAAVDSILEDHLPILPSEKMTRFHPSCTDPAKLLQVQLTRFRCGGLVVGVTAHHRVADGQSMSNFYVAWGRIARGLPINRIPGYDISWLRPRFPPKLEFEHWGVEFVPVPPHSTKPFPLELAQVEPTKIANVLLRYSHEFIESELKASLRERFTTFEVLLAHVWRKLTAVRGLSHGETTKGRVTVNGRRRLRPPVADEFVGNLVICAHTSATVGELMDGGLAGAARRVREGVRRIDDAYFRSVIDFGEEYKEAELVPVYEREGNLLSPNMEAESWLGFQFQEMDFGGGTLRAFIPSWVPVEGLVIFLPSLAEEGGVNVMVALLQEDAEILKTISHTLS